MHASGTAGMLDAGEGRWYDFGLLKLVRLHVAFPITAF